MDEAKRISLKDQFNSLLVRAIEGRRGGMALMRVLEELDFYNSPASAKHHLNVPGGLVMHSLNVARAALELCDKIRKKRELPDARNVPGSSRINMIKGLAYSPSAPCEWGINIWQRTCTASLAFQPPRLLCDRAANYGSIIIGVPDDGTIQFSRCARSDVMPCGRCRLGNCPFTYEPSRRVKL